MSATGLDVFDKTLQTTHIWLDDLIQTADSIGPDRQLAWHVLGAVLRTIRDRLPITLAAHLGAELPLLIRGLYYDQFRPSEMPSKIDTPDEFIAEVSTRVAGMRPINVRDAVRAVFAILPRHVDAGQWRKVCDALPERLREWIAGADTPVSIGR